MILIISNGEIAQGQAPPEILHSFALPPVQVAEIFQAADGNFYGISRNGGVSDKGTVFQLTPAGDLTILHSFTGPDGASGAGLVQASNGNFYGTTAGGGAYNQGTAFQLTPTGVLTTLYSFSGGNDGYWPNGGLIQAADGNLYGTTSREGAYGVGGTVFQLTPMGAFTTLYRFSGYNDGDAPNGGLIQGTDGNLYGTTQSGGWSNEGTVFRLTLSGTLTTLHTFTGPDGSFPNAGLIQGADGNFYGTTSSGGSYSAYGTVFRLTPNGGFFTLYSFTWGSDGWYPAAGLIQAADGNLYGTTVRGGNSGNGTVFRLTLTGVLTPVHSFTTASDGGSYPSPPLTRGVDGNLYGSNGDTVFRVDSAGTFSTLLWLNSPDGSNPAAGPLIASDGNLYGTTSKGGPYNAGTVFNLTPGGAFTAVYTFSGPDGAIPLAGLIQASDGNFYGTTSEGGASNKGTVFQLTPGGVLNTLYSFTGPDGANPYAGLIQAADGNFYGTTYAGGTFDKGTVFKLTPTGALTVLHSIQGQDDGAHPQASLIQASDGNFYGTTSQVGNGYYYGAVFRLTPNGSFTTLHTFVLDGHIPVGGLVQGDDGALYGMTSSAGLSWSFIYKVTLDGVFTSLHQFTSDEGGCPSAGLTRAKDGNFYGITSACTSRDGGTVLRMTPAGSVGTVYTFGDSDGIDPVGTLAQASDGSFYGIMSAGGPVGGGVVFKLTVAASLVPVNVQFGGAGQGTVTFDGSHVSCVAACSALYAPGTSVTLSAVPATGSEFMGWSGGCSGTGSCTVTTNGEATVTATFAYRSYQLTVTLAGNGTGTVTSSSSPAIICGAICSQSFLYGPYATDVTLAATPSLGSLFVGWSGGGCSGDSTCMVWMNQAQNVTATFTSKTPPETTILTGPFGTIADNRVMFTWTGSDSVTRTAYLTYAVRLDPLEPSYSGFASSTTRDYGPLANGSYTFYVKAKNSQGAEDPTPASRSFTVSAPSSYDPLVSQQWLLESRGVETAGADVLAAWGASKGTGIVIGIVDDGLQYTHPDLQPNYIASLSWDFDNDAPDPSPSTAGSCWTTADCHGTAVAGIAAARGENGIGISGVAPLAALAGLRLIAAPASDAQVAAALGYKPDEIHISNNSWGPEGALADLGPLGHAAIQTAIQQGRGGKGRIFVRAAGNSGDIGDNCNFDGFANSRFVIAVGALNDLGYQTSYSEPCSSLLVTAPSGDIGGRRGITTTDLVGAAGYDPSDYTSAFSGTSASAPVVSGVVALMLAENPALTWRDVQHILVRSAIKTEKWDSGWTEGAGLVITHGVPVITTTMNQSHNERYGFGLVDAEAAVGLAANWTLVPPESATTPITHRIHQSIPDGNPSGLSDTITIDSAYANFRVEHVEVVLDATHPRRGDLEVTLTSPAGVVSHLATVRAWDTGADFPAWQFGSVRHWGELAAGAWTLQVTDRAAGAVGIWNSWTLKLFGIDGTQPLVVSKAGAGTGTVNAATSGIACVDACSGSYPYNASVTLLATPDAGSTFVGWSGACTGSGSCTVTMNQAQSLTATFSLYPILAVGTSGPGVGKVTSFPAGIDCGVACTSGFVNNAVVVLTASPGYGSIFTGWSGNCGGSASCALTMDGPKSAIASFAEGIPLTVALTGGGGGSVVSNPSGINCGQTCNASFFSGTPVTLTAAPASDSDFTGWNGGGCSGTGVCPVTLNAATTVTATFTLKPLVKADLTTPTPGTQLAESTVSFGWTTGTNVSEYYLEVGNAPYDTAYYGQSVGTNLSATVTGLPTDGRALNVRLWSKLGARWAYSDYPYTAANLGPVKADLTTPAPGTQLAGSIVTFGWNTGTAVSEYYLEVGNAPYDTAYYGQSVGTALSATVSNLPTDGRALNVRLWSKLGARWAYGDFNYTSANFTPVKAELAAPTPGTQLTGSTVTFGWNTGAGVSEYYLEVGGTLGGTNYYGQSVGTSLSATVSGLPTNGSTLSVRLWSKLGSRWAYTDYTYTANGTVPVKADLTSPTPGSSLAGSTVTFGWNTGTSVSEYYLEVGNVPYDTAYYGRSQGTNLSATVSNLPTDGRMLNVRLWSKLGSRWAYTDYTYTANGTVPVKADLTSPVPGSKLSGSTVTFAWMAGTNASEYYLEVGNAPYDTAYYGQSVGTNLSATVTGLPTDGRALNVRLWSKLGSRWAYSDYPYTATGSTATPAVLTSPTPNSKLSGSTVTFAWTPGTNASEYYLEVGNALYDTAFYGQSVGTALSATVSGLPTDGRALNVRLWSKLGVRWAYADYTYTAAYVATPPTLSNLQYSPSSARQGSGTATVNGTVTFTDTGGDLTLVRITIVATGQVADLPVTTTLTSGTVQVIAYVDTSVAGTFTFTVQAFDRGGSSSNALTGTFTVVP